MAGGTVNPHAGCVLWPLAAVFCVYQIICDDLLYWPCHVIAVITVHSSVITRNVIKFFNIRLYYEIWRSGGLAR